MKNVFFSIFTIAVLIIGFIVLSKLKSYKIAENGIAKTEQSIAVLPFLNINNNAVASPEYFSDGLTEGILNSLAQIKDLKVSSRTSSFKFRGKDIDIKEAGKKLGVRTILEGSVQQSEDRVRITVQLINVEDNFHFWSEQYDEKIDDVFALQDKIARAISKKLEITLLAPKPLRVNQNSTINKEAYDLYLKGRFLWNKGTPADLKNAIALFEQAINLDRGFARAYAAIADCYNALGYGSNLSPKEAGPKAKENAIKALELDSTLAEPHASLGFCKFYYDWDWAEAEEEFRTSLALNPNYEIGYKWYGYYLTAMKRYDEAIVIFEKASTLDPLSVPINTDIGFSLYCSGKYEEAIKKLNISLQMNPKFPLAHLWLGRAFQAKQMYKEAIDESKKSLLAIPDWPVGLAQLGNVYGISGNTTEARKILDTLILLSPKKFVTAYGMGLVYAGIDEKEKAFQWLNKAYEERSNWLVWLKTDPRWTSIIADKRFTELVNKIGLPSKNREN